MRMSLYEILKKASEIKDREERKVFLAKNKSGALTEVIKYALDPTIKWILPAGSPPYKENQDVDSHGNLYANVRKLYLFVEGGNPNLTKLKRETLFIQLLETVHPEDAKLLLAIKDKKLPFKINLSILKAVFPELNLGGENEPE